MRRKSKIGAVRAAGKSEAQAIGAYEKIDLAGAMAVARKFSAGASKTAAGQKCDGCAAAGDAPPHSSPGGTPLPSCGPAGASHARRGAVAGHRKILAAANKHEDRLGHFARPARGAN
jgi:hypothetical protein